MAIEETLFNEKIQQLDESIRLLQESEYENFLAMLQINEGLILTRQRHFNRQDPLSLSFGFGSEPYVYPPVKAYIRLVDNIHQDASPEQKGVLIPKLLRVLEVINHRVEQFKTQPALSQEFIPTLIAINEKLQELPSIAPLKNMVDELYDSQDMVDVLVDSEDMVDVSVDSEDMVDVLVDSEDKVDVLVDSENKVDVLVDSEDKVDEINDSKNKVELLAIIAQLKTNILTQQNGRSTTRNSPEKVALLSLIEDLITVDEDINNNKVNQYITEIRTVCAMRRNAIHFWAQPHSVNEFETLLASSSLANLEPRDEAELQIG